MSSKTENFARFGIASKGFVYVIMGLLVAFSALNMGGRVVGTDGVLNYLSEKPFGQIILAIVAVGMVAYGFWLGYQSVYDPKNSGSDWKGWLIRIALMFGALFYLAIAFVAVKIALGGSSGSNMDKASKFMNSENGSIYTIIIGIIILGKALYELYLAYSKEYREDVFATELEYKTKEALLKWGRFGFTARGLVFGILGFLTLRAGVTYRLNDINTSSDAFGFIQTKFGGLILWVIAIGLIGFGVFMFVKSRYEHLRM